MNITHYIFEFIIFIGIIVIFFTIKNLLPSYFDEKGKNLATKEDISDITELVESVKHSFSIETERLKANLLYMTNMQIGTYAEERNAIIEYNEKYFIWLNSLSDHYFGDVDDSDNQDLEKESKNIGKKYRDFLYSETKFNLFIDNRNLLEKGNEMKLETLKKLGQIAPKCLMKFKHSNISLSFIPKDSVEQHHIDERKKLLDKKLEIYNDFSTEMLSNLKEVVPLTREFQNMCREHIYEIIKREENKI